LIHRLGFHHGDRDSLHVLEELVGVDVLFELPGGHTFLLNGHGDENRVGSHEDSLATSFEEDCCDATHEKGTEPWNPERGDGIPAKMAMRTTKNMDM